MWALTHLLLIPVLTAAIAVAIIFALGAHGVSVCPKPVISSALTHRV